MDPIAAETMIKLKEHYEQLLAEERKKTQMFESMIKEFTNIHNKHQLGNCVRCDKLCYSVVRSHRIDPDMDNPAHFFTQFNFQKCLGCGQHICEACYEEISPGYPKCQECV